MMLWRMKQYNTYFKSNKVWRTPFISAAILFHIMKCLFYRCCVVYIENEEQWKLASPPPKESNISFLTKRYAKHPLLSIIAWWNCYTVPFAMNVFSHSTRRYGHFSNPTATSLNIAENLGYIPILCGMAGWYVPSSLEGVKMIDYSCQLSFTATHFSSLRPSTR